MQYTNILLSVLFASSALARPARRSTSDNSIVVQLSGPGELVTQTSFDEGWRQAKAPVGSAGPYDTVLLTLGADVKQQDLRCQVLDEYNKPIIVNRKTNREITFSDAPGGEWTFEAGAQNVVAIICDPAFKKGNPAAPEPPINVRIDGLDEFARNIAFVQGGLLPETQPAGGENVNMFTLTLDPAIQDKDLRCQVLDNYGNPILGRRGPNVDVTFGDAGKGPWTFINKHNETINVDTSLVVCDPAFVKADKPLLY
ncbi:hypothetical protein N0V86_002815 [Didymella sp. IMI 355093]|nr:hypothetical protein N0V86_002815 [Didymella sp. IMI 355093]